MKMNVQWIAIMCKLAKNTFPIPAIQMYSQETTKSVKQIVAECYALLKDVNHPPYQGRQQSKNSLLVCLGVEE